MDIARLTSLAQEAMLAKLREKLEGAARRGETGIKIHIQHDGELLLVYQAVQRLSQNPGDLETVFHADTMVICVSWRPL